MAKYVGKIFKVDNKKIRIKNNESLHLKNDEIFLIIMRD